MVLLLGTLSGQHEDAAVTALDFIHLRCDLALEVKQTTELPK